MHLLESGQHMVVVHADHVGDAGSELDRQGAHGRARSMGVLRCGKPHSCGAEVRTPQQNSPKADDTVLRPAPLARYRASSAARSRSSKETMRSSSVLTPTLTV